MDYSDNPYLRILNALSSPDLDEDYQEERQSNKLLENNGQKGKKLLTGNRTNTALQKRTAQVQRKNYNRVIKRMTQEQSAQSYMDYANYLIEEMDNENFNGMWFITESEMPFYESIFGSYRQEESGYGEEFRDSYSENRKQYDKKQKQRQEQFQEERYYESYTPPSDDTAFDRINRKRKKLLEELGLPETANIEEAKREYRKLMLKYHPDKIVRETESVRREYEEKAKRINEAYDKIKNQQFLD